MKLALAARGNLFRDKFALLSRLSSLFTEKVVRMVAFPSCAYGNISRNKTFLGAVSRCSRGKSVVRKRRRGEASFAQTMGHLFQKSGAAGPPLAPSVCPSCPSCPFLHLRCGGGDSISLCPFSFPQSLMGGGILGIAFARKIRRYPSDSATKDFFIWVDGQLISPIYWNSLVMHETCL